MAQKNQKQTIKTRSGRNIKPPLHKFDDNIKVINENGLTQPTTVKSRLNTRATKRDIVHKSSISKNLRKLSRTEKETNTLDNNVISNRQSRKISERINPVSTNQELIKNQTGNLALSLRNKKLNPGRKDGNPEKRANVGLKNVSTKPKDNETVEEKPIVKECKVLVLYKFSDLLKLQKESKKPKLQTTTDESDINTPGSLPKTQISSQPKPILQKSNSKDVTSSVSSNKAKTCEAALKTKNKQKRNEKTILKKIEIEGTQKVQTEFQKNTEILNCNLKNSSPVSRFRKRIDVDYAENSLDMTTSDMNNKKKVPVYQQQLNDEIIFNGNGDQYEFDSDSEKYKKRKRRKLDDSDKYNKTIKEILKKIVNKTKKHNKKVMFSDKKCHFNIKRVQKPQPKKQSPLKHETDTPPASENHDNSKIETSLAGKEATFLNDHEGVPETEKYINARSPNILNDAPNLLQENLHEEIYGNDESLDLDSSNDEYFGFATSGTVTKPKIKILSDIQLQPGKELNLSIASPTLFKDGRPKANSTMLNNVLTPWRFNEINVKRNPHFITLKKSSLPCISQEMVLDHTIVDKLGDTSKAENETSSKEKWLKKSVHSEVTDYFDPNNENKENTQINLFDSDHFSPIKNKNKLSHRVDLVKRKVLGERNSNILEAQLTSTPNRDLKEPRLPEVSSPNKSNRNFINFGFDSNSNLDENNENVSPIKNKESRPFRFSTNINDRKYHRKKNIKQIVKPKPIVSSDEESDKDDVSDLESPEGEVKLFEDMAITQEIIEFQEAKAMKKRKLKCHNYEKHKRRKDQRTKEEEEEAEKWAAAFNSMCEEIEEFPLEVE